MNLRTKIGVVFILSQLILLSSCLKVEVYPDEPVITYKSFEVFGDSAIITISFTDGDGDIGLSTGDTIGNYAPDSYFYFNAYLEYYEYMKSYSPYDNVKAQDYPNLLVTTGLHDSQVQYWEPAKWVAKLRDLKTDDNLLLLKTNMEAGHGGASGRFEYIKELALEYAFLISLTTEKNN